MDTPVIIIIYTLSLCIHLYGISIGIEGRACYWRRIDVGMAWNACVLSGCRPCICCPCPSLIVIRSCTRSNATRMIVFLPLHTYYMYIDSRI
jgi:hypothetical protein